MRTDGHLKIKIKSQLERDADGRTFENEENPSQREMRTKILAREIGTDGHLKTKKILAREMRTDGHLKTKKILAREMQTDGHLKTKKFLAREMRTDGHLK